MSKEYFKRCRKDNQLRQRSPTIFDLRAIIQIRFNLRATCNRSDVWNNRFTIFKTKQGK